MSLLAQIGLGILVAGGIGWGVWNHKHHEDMVREPMTQQTTADVHLTTGNTNTDLDADLRSIDGQLKTAGDASVGIDQSMEDKPITQ